MTSVIFAGTDIASVSIAEPASVWPFLTPVASSYSAKKGMVEADGLSRGAIALLQLWFKVRSMRCAFRHSNHWLMARDFKSSIGPTGV